MKKLLVLLVLTLSMLATPMVAPSEVSAAVDAQCDKSSSFLGLPTWYKYLDVKYDSETESCDVVSPGDEEMNWEEAVGLVALAIIEILGRIAALVAVAFVMYGGFRYITSQGDPENAKSARQTIINALIGLVVSIVATTVVAFIASRLTN